MPCAAKPVMISIQTREFMPWNCCRARQNLWQLQFHKVAMQGCNTSAANCAAAAMRGKTCGLCNTSPGNYATAVIRGKPLVAAKQARENLWRLKTSAGIYAVELLPCAAKPVAVAI